MSKPLKRWANILVAAAVVWTGCGDDPQDSEPEANCPFGCVAAPSPLCQGDELVTYDAVGGCLDGACFYPSQTITCEFGCADGACLSEVCADVVCDSPPASSCVGDAILRYDDAGQCDAVTGGCTYASSVSACDAGSICSVESGEPVCVAVATDCVDDGEQNGLETDVDCGGGCGLCADGSSCSEDSDCAGDRCVAGLCAAPSCTDGRANGGETDIDCGGACGPCLDGRACLSRVDCVSGVCADGLCAAPSCDDRVQNGDEIGRDCGGSCGGCPGGSACSGPTDCLSSLCVDNVCVAPACYDGLQNQNETDVDCGGPCEPCAAGRACGVDGDCETGLCSDGTCRGPTCDDGELNGAESDVDCGGGCPVRCGEGLVCGTGRDCLTGTCVDNRCASPSCTDGVRNADESDIDCGGALCDACDAGLSCVEDDDCVTGRCAAGRCAPASCTDGIFNGPETDLDCGGGCDPCAVGQVCQVGSDCVEGVCDPVDGTCAAPTCFDSVQNGAETGPDCGGPCDARCDLGGGCESNGDCEDLLCISNTCSATCDDGRRNGTEAGIDCGGFCLSCGTGGPCVRGTDCASFNCVDAPGVVAECGAGNPCAVGTCDDGLCVGSCAAATCDDGVQNQGELAIDCGGPCGRCIVECEDGVQTWNLADFQISDSLWRHRGATALMPESSISYFDFASCADIAGFIGPESVYRFEVPQGGLYEIRTDIVGTPETVDTAIHVYRDICAPDLTSDIACSDESDSGIRAELTVRLRAGDVAFIVVDTTRPRFAASEYAVEVTLLDGTP